MLIKACISLTLHGAGLSLCQSSLCRSAWRI